MSVKTIFNGVMLTSLVGAHGNIACLEADISDLEKTKATIEIKLAFAREKLIKLESEFAEQLFRYRSKEA